MTRPRALVAWSTGKDGAWALHVARQRDDLDIVGLLTTLTATFGRVTMHGVRESLLERQAAAVGLPLIRVGIPSPYCAATYAELMRAALEGPVRVGVDRVVFGDLFLEDMRAYRERQLDLVGMKAVFPLWGRNTEALAREMIDGGLRAIVTCIDPHKLPRSIAGRCFDESLLADLPIDVDPCGENGELHTFVTGGPMFTEQIAVAAGPVVERDGFVFADLIPA